MKILPKVYGRVPFVQSRTLVHHRLNTNLGLRLYEPSLKYPVDKNQKHISLSKEESGHVKVFRIKANEIIELCNGKGVVCKAIVRGQHRGETIVELTEEPILESKPFCSNLNLFVALPKQTCELIIEKCTELGAMSIQPIITARSQTDIEYVAKRMERWNKLIISSCKQAHISHFPILHTATTLSSALTTPLDDALWLVGDMHGDVNVLELAKQQLAKGHTNINLIVGPEGGFSDSEIELLKNNPNTKFVTLNRARLRTETAAIAFVASIAGILHSVSQPQNKEPTQ